MKERIILSPATLFKSSSAYRMQESSGLVNVVDGMEFFV